MRVSVPYDGWMFLVVPARWEPHPSDPDEELLEECYFEEKLGWKIELQVFRSPKSELVQIPIAYPENEDLFENLRAALSYIGEGYALQDAKRSQLGDNLNQYRKIR